MSGTSPAATLFNAAGTELAVSTGQILPAGTALVVAGGTVDGYAQPLKVDGYGRQVMVSDPTSPIAITGTISATNPSVSTTGAAPPASATYLGGSVTTAAPTYTTGQMSALSLTTAGALRVDNSGTTGTIKITDGYANGPAAVKASSTAAATTDPSLVVSVSPNSPVIPSTTVSGVINSAASSLTIPVAGRNGVGVQIPGGSSYSGRIDTFCSMDNGVTWAEAPVYLYGDAGGLVLSPGQMSAIYPGNYPTNAGYFVIEVAAGITHIKLTGGGWISGTVTVTMTATNSSVNVTYTQNTGGDGANMPWVGTLIGGQSADSSNTFRFATVKSPSTAIVDTDHALVVGLSPNTPLPVQADKSGSGSLGSLNANVLISTQGYTSLLFTLAGTWVGNVVFQYTVDGSTWINDTVQAHTDNKLYGGATGNNTWIATVGGYQQYRLYMNAYTSGSATVTYNLGTGGNVIQTQNLIFDASNNGPVAVKTANTPAVAADPALVVALSPNFDGTGVFPVTMGDPGTVDTFGNLVQASRFAQIQIPFFQAAPSTILNITGTGTSSQSLGMGLFSSGVGTTNTIKAQTFGTVAYGAHNELYSAFTVYFTTPTATSTQQIGIYDTVNGFRVGYNGTQFGLWTRYNSVDTFVAQSSFNVDTLSAATGSKFKQNGTAVSLDPLKINLFRIRYGWLGIAPIIFEILSPDGKFVVFHQTQHANLQATVTITNPNLPITLEITKSAGAQNLTMGCGCWVAGTAAGTSPFVSGVGSIAASSAAVNLPTIGHAGLSIGITGTWSGTIAFQYSNDGQTWVNDTVMSAVTGLTTFVQSTTTNGNFEVAVGGYKYYRVFFTAWTSGTANIFYTGATASSFLPVQSFITDGSNNGPVAVKPASTAAVATDAALVVAISPNNSITTSNISVGTVGSAVPASATQIAGTDGTNLRVPVVMNTNPSGSEYGIVVRAVGGGLSTVNQGTPAILGNAWPVRIVDGSSNQMPAMDISTRAGWVKVTDGSGNVQAMMDTAGRAGFQRIVDASGNSMPVGDIASRGMYVRPTDGTNVPAVKGASTVAVATDPSMVVAISPNSPSGQGAPNTSANAWPIRLTDGAGTYMPTMDAANHRGYMSITDGTNTAAVKAANVPAASTDPAIVVSLNPGSPMPNGTITPADTYGNPTNAQLEFSLQGLWNGSSWDRARGSATLGTFVSGPVATGAAVPANPLLMGASDGTGIQNIRAIAAGTTITGTEYAVIVRQASQGANTAAFPGWSQQIAGNDGTSLRPLKTDTSGNQIVIGPNANGGGLTGNPVRIAASSGTSTFDIKCDTSGNLIMQGLGTAGTPSGGVLSVQGVGGGTALPVTFSGNVTVVQSTASNLNAQVVGPSTAFADATSNTQAAVATSGFIFGFNGTTWDRIRSQASSGDAVATLGTGLLTTAGYNYGYNGTTWDRLRSSTSNGLQVDVTRVTGSVTVAQATAASLNATVVQGNAGTAAQGWFAKVTDGTNTAAVKAASTVPVATDPSLVVSLSPNSAAFPDTVSSGALGSFNALVSVLMTGEGSAGFQLSAGTLIGTLTPYYSMDAVNWRPTVFVDAVTGLTSSALTYASSNTLANETIVTPGGASHVAVIVTAYTSGTANAVIRSVASGPAAQTVLGSNGTGLQTLSLSSNGAVNINSPDTATTGALGSNGAAVSILMTGQGSVGFQLAAGTLIGTLTPQYSMDALTWQPAGFIDAVTGAYSATLVYGSSNTLANKTIVLPGGCSHARVVVTAYTSGTANASIRAVAFNPGIVSLNPNGNGVAATQGPGSGAAATYWYARITDGTNSMPTMDAVARKGFQSITDGTNGPAAVKAASTAAAAADPALVVSVSPNTPAKIWDGTSTAAVKAASTAAAAADPALVVSLSPNSPIVKPYTTGAVTSVASSATNVVLLAANTNRAPAGAFIVNTTSATVYIRMGSTAATTAAGGYSFTLAAGAQWSIPAGLNFTGAFQAIWTAGGVGSITVTEITP